MPKQARMTTTRGRAAPVDEVFGPMAIYQQLLGQTEEWISFSGDGAEHKKIADMAAPYAINALHKLSRWTERLYSSSTSKQFEDAQRKLYEAPLVDALIQAALGEFYNASLILPHMPHVDDFTPPGGDITFTEATRRLEATVALDSQLLEASIDGAAAIDQAPPGTTLGRRARVLYDVLTATITLPEDS